MKIRSIKINGTIHRVTEDQLKQATVNFCSTPTDGKAIDHMIKQTGKWWLYPKIYGYYILARMFGLGKCNGGKNGTTERK
jgi:hypothetical protein